MSAPNDGGLGQRVGLIERQFEGFKSDLKQVGVALGEIKLAISSARPSWYVLVPIALSIILLIAGGVAEVGSLKGEISALNTLKAARDQQFEGIDRRLGTLEQRQWEELRADRDHLRAVQK